MLKSAVDLYPTFNSNQSKSFITAYRKVNLYNAPNTSASKTNAGKFIIYKFDISEDGKWIRYVDKEKLFSTTSKTYYLSTKEVSIKANYGISKSGKTNILDVPKYIKLNSFETAYIRMYYEIRLVEAIKGKLIDEISEEAYNQVLKELETYTSDQLKEKLLKVRTIPVIRAAENVYKAIDDYESIFSDILLGVQAQLYYHIIKADKGKGITLNYTNIGLIKSSASQ